MVSGAGWPPTAPGESRVRGYVRHAHRRLVRRLVLGRGRPPNEAGFPRPALARIVTWHYHLGSRGNCGRRTAFSVRPPALSPGGPWIRRQPLDLARTVGIRRNEELTR